MSKINIPCFSTIEMTVSLR